MISTAVVPLCSAGIICMRQRTIPEHIAAAGTTPHTAHMPHYSLIPSAVPSDSTGTLNSGQPALLHWHYKGTTAVCLRVSPVRMSCLSVCLSVRLSHLFPSVGVCSEKQMVPENMKKPYEFELFHASTREPVDLYAWGNDFFRPLVELDKSM